MSEPYFPQATFAPAAASNNSARAILAPPRYVQGPDVLARFDRLCAGLGIACIGLLASRRGHASQAGTVSERCASANMTVHGAVFGGECSMPEIDAHVAHLREFALDALIAVGGGKCVDAGKCIAHRLGVPIIVVPTLASNDAPCSALSVTYTPEGIAMGAEFFPLSPIMVAVDTSVVAAASERYLVAGMGDAMATWYEARVCRNNPHGTNVLGTRPTMAAGALGELCARTLFESGLAACESLRDGKISESLEDVVEANTLLSGIGFESGGLAGAHAYAQGYTAVSDVERNYLHGEMVGMGVLAQLMMEDDPSEARRVARFFAKIGLPIHLGQLSLAAEQRERLDEIVAGAMTFEPLANFEFTVTPEMLLMAMLEADEMGRAIAAADGDEAYRRLQAL